MYLPQHLEQFCSLTNQSDIFIVLSSNPSSLLYLASVLTVHSLSQPHELALPISNPGAPVLIVRSCRWRGESPNAWDAKLLDTNNEIPEDLKRAILGSRRIILFVEGQQSSLDIPLYSALFPKISVIPIGSCADVIKSVLGLRNSQQFHDVRAFGLVDRDNRRDDDIAKLEAHRIYALSGYSVESLYYSEESMKAVADWQERSLGFDANRMFTNARRSALESLTQDEIAKRMAVRRCAGVLREQIVSKIPGPKDIFDDPDRTIRIAVELQYQEELSRFNKLLTEEDLTTIIARYPIHKTPVLTEIAKAFSLTRISYERTLATRVRDDTDLAEALRQRIQPLSDAIDREG